ncbi:MAG: thioredoxin family protein [Candidatus Melainabacteria bacterium]|nr:MAG: thioredoxin family protein [Candidatus Melainabacteria bacterium]
MIKKAIAAAITLLLSCSAVFAHPSIFSDLTLSKARQKAKSEHKHLLLDFTAEWCGPCKQMDKTTWTDAKVISWLNKNAIAVQLDVDNNKKFAEDFNIAAMPTVVIFQPQDIEKEFDRDTGYKEPTELLKWLENIALNINSLKMAQDRVEKLKDKVSDESVEAHYDLAGKLFDKGNYDQATEHFLYVWKNGAQTPMVGVRGSYMIDQISALCKKSNKAKQIFEKVRDESQANSDDWVMLNSALDENDKTLAWFDKAKNDPKKKKKSCRCQINFGRLTTSRQQMGRRILSISRT